jgi:hypothetical protein
MLLKPFLNQRRLLQTPPTRLGQRRSDHGGKRN